jgi:hypothetical protein
MIEGNGVAAAFTYGIDPRLEAPTFAYQLDSAASQYADRFLRARGSGVRLRWLAARCFGYDPALGAVVVMGRKS